MGPDFRVLVAKARKIAQAYWKVYGEYPPTKVLVQEVAGVMQKATQSGYVSPFFIFISPVWHAFSLFDGREL
jgi:20S proteasome subunit alpha 2